MFSVALLPACIVFVMFAGLHESPEVITKKNLPVPNSARAGAIKRRKSNGIKKIYEATFKNTLYGALSDPMTLAD